MSAIVQFVGLLAGSLLVSYLLHLAGAPAAILVGPMLVAIGFGVGGTTFRVPRIAFTSAQGVIGCLIAGSVTFDVVRDVVAEWHWMLFGLLSTIAASTAIGWLMTRLGMLPGTSAAWGSSPGAASAMVAMAEEFGADARLVALMQYVRVICVVLAASLVTRLLWHGDVRVASVAAGPAAAATPASFAPLGLAATLVIAIGGAWLGRRFRVPAGGLMVPLAIATTLTLGGFVHLVLPNWLLVATYAAVGWYVGLQFERDTVLHALRVLPQVVGAAVAVVVLAGLAAALMAAFGPHDFLTTFLATSPGGIDSVAILALDGGADAPFVMAMQTLRVLIVVATGPAIARALARTAPGPVAAAGKPLSRAEPTAARTEPHEPPSGAPLPPDPGADQHAAARAGRDRQAHDRP